MRRPISYLSFFSYCSFFFLARSAKNCIETSLHPLHLHAQQFWPGFVNQHLYHGASDYNVLQNRHSKRSMFGNWRIITQMQSTLLSRLEDGQTYNLFIVEYSQADSEDKQAYSPAAMKRYEVCTKRTMTQCLSSSMQQLKWMTGPCTLHEL
jgi:hypothetical protein